MIVMVEVSLDDLAFLTHRVREALGAKLDDVAYHAFMAPASLDEIEKGLAAPTALQFHEIVDALRDVAHENKLNDVGADAQPPALWREHVDLLRRQVERAEGERDLAGQILCDALPLPKNLAPPRRIIDLAREAAGLLRELRPRVEGERE